MHIITLLYCNLLFFIEMEINFSNDNVHLQTTPLNMFTFINGLYSNRVEDWYSTRHLVYLLKNVFLLDKSLESLVVEYYNVRDRISKPHWQIRIILLVIIHLNKIPVTKRIIDIFKIQIFDCYFSFLLLLLVQIPISRLFKW